MTVFFNRICWSTRSNALRKSTITQPTSLPALKALSHESIIRIMADYVECFARKPLCDLWSKLKLFKNDEKLISTHFSMNLDIVGRIQMGL